MNMHLFLSVTAALVVILLASQVFGRLAQKIGQPAVVGEMVAGVALGPSLLGMVAPELMDTIFTKDVKSILFVLSNLGLAFYMFLVGAEMDLDTMTRKSLKRSGLLAASGIVPAFAFGVLIAIFLYESVSVQNINLFTFCIFMGSALSITAFPMLARILQERGITKTRIGSLTLIAASIDDALAWCLMALVTAMAQAQSMMTGLYTALGGVAFALVMLVLVRPLLKKLGDRTEKQGFMSSGGFAIVIMMVLACAWVTDFIGIYSVFGGFICGIAMPRGKVFQEQLHGKLTDIVVVFLVPIFFAYSGLNTKLGGLTELSLLVPFMIILIASVAGKYGGCTLAMRGMGFSWRESSAIGGLMNARGLMELILLNIGISYGVINQDLFSIFVLMAIITTAIAMPVYNWSMPKSLSPEVDPELKQSGVSS